MRNIWVAVIGVLTLTLFAGSSFATAPVAGDIPDIKLLTGSQTVNDFDLDAYVTDYDDDESGLNWTIDGVTGFDSGDPSSITDGHLVDLAGKSASDQGEVSYKVSDATESDTDSQTVKYSSFLLVGPSLTQDNNLVPPDSFVRSWVIKGEETLTTPAIAGLLSAGAPAVGLTVSIADLAGDLKAGDNVTDVVYGDLHASISGDGKLVLTTPTGAYPRTAGQAQLTGAYRVGVKAKATGGGLAGAEDNWDGMEILAAVAQYPSYDTTGFPATKARLDQFCDFEVGTVPKTLAANVTALRAETDPNAPKWCTSNVSGTPTAQIVGTGIPASAWATSGNALKVTVAATDKVMVLSEWFLDFAPGETITVQANVTSDAATSVGTGNLMMFVGNFHAHGNYQGTAWAANSTNAEIPYNNSWRTMKVTFPVDTVGANLQSGTETFNAYQRGYQIALYFTGSASMTGAQSFYVDNVRVFRNLDPIDMALAATDIAVVKQGTTTPFDGTLETAVDAADWNQTGLIQNGTGRLDTTGLNNMFSHEGTKALEMFLPTYTGTKQTHQLQYRAGTGMTDQDGIYGASVWVKSDAPDAKSTLDVMAVVSEPGFRCAGFASTGFVGLPLAGAGWKKILVSNERVGVTDRLWLTLIINSGPIAVDAYAYWPTWLKGTENPGDESDAHVFFDDVKFVKMLDDAKFFDRSVFPATD